MGKYWTTLTLCLVTAGALAQPYGGEELYKQSLPSVMTLNVELADGNSQGTAFLAIKDGIAVTAWHVVANAKSAVAKFSDGEEFEVSGVIDFDAKRDIALLKVKVSGRPLLDLDSNLPNIGAVAFALGAPRGLDFSISNGIVSQIQSVENVKQVQFTCAVSPGNSGGPLISDGGKVIGVISWQVTNGQNLNFAVPSQYVAGLDSSLATTPWESVKLPVPVAGGKSLSRDAALAILKLRIEANKEAESAFDWQTAITTVSPRNLTMPQTVFAAVGALPRIRRQFSEIETGVPEVQQALSGMVESLTESIDGFSKIIQATVEAKSNLEWNASANTLAQMGMSKIFKGTKSPLVPIVPMIEAALTEEDKSVFHPDLIRLLLNSTADYPYPEILANGLRLDLRILLRMRLSYVDKKLAGGKAGLKPLDEILSWNDNTFSTWAEVNAFFKANKGEKVKLRVRNPKGAERDVRLQL